MIRRPPRSTLSSSSAASDVYKRQHPYSVYSELDWEVPVERPSVKGADCYDRYRIRVEEMRVSAMMVLEALEKIPRGADTYHEPGDPALIAKAPSRAPEGASGSHHFEDSRGESMFYLAGGGEARGKNPYRVSIRSPMFITIPYACLLYTSPSPRDATLSRMPSSA